MAGLPAEVSLDGDRPIFMLVCFGVVAFPDSGCHCFLVGTVALLCEPGGAGCDRVVDGVGDFMYEKDAAFESVLRDYDGVAGGVIDKDSVNHILGKCGQQVPHWPATGFRLWMGYARWVARAGSRGGGPDGGERQVHEGGVQRSRDGVYKPRAATSIWMYLIFPVLWSKYWGSP